MKATIIASLDKEIKPQSLAVLNASKLHADDCLHRIKWQSIISHICSGSRPKPRVILFLNGVEDSTHLDTANTPLAQISPNRGGVGVPSVTL